MDLGPVAHAIAQHVRTLLVEEQRPCFAHVASYDPKRGTVRVILPSFRDDNNVPVLSGWLPFGAPSAGAGGGVQYHPVTGATQQNPTLGEQCQIGFFGSAGGISAAPCFHFGSSPTPSALLPENDPIQPGETVIAVAQGGYVRLRKNGGLDEQSTVAVRIGNLAEVLQPLLNLAGMILFNAHQHAGVQPGNGSSGPPMQKMEQGTHTTTILQAN